MRSAGSISTYHIPSHRAPYTTVPNPQHSWKLEHFRAVQKNFNGSGIGPAPRLTCTDNHLDFRSLNYWGVFWTHRQDPMHEYGDRERVSKQDKGRNVKTVVQWWNTKRSHDTDGWVLIRYGRTSACKYGGTEVSVVPTIGILVPVTSGWTPVNTHTGCLIAHSSLIVLTRLSSVMTRRDPQVPLIVEDSMGS